jgi:hypothetical protein
MSKEELDEAVEKLSGAITMMTSKIDKRILMMALFKLLSENVVYLQHERDALIALSIDFEMIAADLKERAMNAKPTNLN